MRRIKEVLRLHYESGLGLRQISRALSVSPATGQTGTPRRVGSRLSHFWQQAVGV